MKSAEANSNTAKQLIWAYFWLLILEGALRKWIVPSLSTPLLIVRDPIVILIYMVAASEGKFPKNPFIVWTIILAFFCFLASFSGQGTVVVTLYGLRTDFLQLPLIFLIPQVLTTEDVKKIGKWVLILSVPMAVIALFQFRAPPDARINAGAGGEVGAQLYASSGKVRPSGTFSFVNGMVCYLSMVGAFVLYSFLQHWPYKRLISYSAMGALGLCLLVSGSRSAILTVSIVLVVAVIVCMIKGKHFGSALKPLISVFLILFILSFLPVFKEGMAVNQSRFEGAGGFKEGIWDRILGDFIAGFKAVDLVPFFGLGLGIGTNAGAGLLSGARGFLLSEGEWARVVMESGPFLGFAFIGLRLAILAYLVSKAWKALDRGAVLPSLLLGAIGLDLIYGQFSQPTAMGFVILGGGLSLAAGGGIEETEDTPDEPVETGVRKIKGRSSYAEALHGKS